MNISVRSGEDLEVSLDSSDGGHAFDVYLSAVLVDFTPDALVDFFHAVREATQKMSQFERDQFWENVHAVIPSSSAHEQAVDERDDLWRLLDQIDTISKTRRAS